jgi:hypothetical protein
VIFSASIIVYFLSVSHFSAPAAFTQISGRPGPDHTHSVAFFGVAGNKVGLEIAQPAVATGGFCRYFGFLYGAGRVFCGFLSVRFGAHQVFAEGLM